MAVARRFLLVVLLCTGALAQENPQLEDRVKDLAHELRCLVCQNQTIADSNAPLALDLRNQIREQLAAGSSDREVIDYMVARYGDFVLYRPPFKLTTVLLWLGPLALVVAGFLFLARLLRARRRVETPGLTPEERSRAERMLSGAPDRKP